MKKYRNGMTSKECDTPGGGPVITKQEDKRAADINNILANYQRTGDVSLLMPKGTPQYGDFSQAMEYEDALNLVRQVDNAFAKWPSAARDAANNDPLTALNMLADEAGRARVEAAAKLPAAAQPAQPVKTPAPSEAGPVAAPKSPGTV